MLGVSICRYVVDGRIKDIKSRMIIAAPSGVGGVPSANHRGLLLNFQVLVGTA